MQVGERSHTKEHERFLPLYGPEGQQGQREELGVGKY